MCVHRETGAQRAVKVLRKSHMDDDEKRMLFNEINILKDIVSRLTLLCICVNALQMNAAFDASAVCETQIVSLPDFRIYPVQLWLTKNETL